MLHNIHSYHTPLSYLLVCVSTGYFVQDAGDIILTGHAKRSWEFLLHHALVIWSFLYALYTQLYIAGAVIALFVEVNNVTLHLRLMLKMANAHSSATYQINKLVNIFTYVTFRLSTQFYLTWYIIHNYSWLDHSGNRSSSRQVPVLHRDSLPKNKPQNYRQTPASGRTTVNVPLHGRFYRGITRRESCVEWTVLFVEDSVTFSSINLITSL
ncbi:hypothetical protein LDENG_00217320 [Lucifuga dentata]|nr:hypothetical protein LDENG_00217320 [Lucifuga dentata]